MPLGKDIQFNFVTSTAPGGNVYPFDTGKPLVDNDPVIPDAVLLGPFKAYTGAFPTGSFYVQTNIDFWLCEQPNADQYDLNIFELNVQCPATYWTTGTTAEVELTTDRVINTNIDFWLCDKFENNPHNYFYFGSECSDYNIKNGTSCFIDELVTVRGDSFPQYNLGVCCPYDIPAKHDVTIEFNESIRCDDYYTVVHSTCADASLDTSPVTTQNFDFDICSVRWGTQATIVDSFGDTRPEDDELELIAHNGITEVVYEYNPTTCAQFGNTLDPVLIHAPIVASVDLYVEKNTSWDLQLCPNELVPLPDEFGIIDHDFRMRSDYMYVCDDIMGDGYTGEFMQVNLLSDIVLEGLNNSFGHNTELDLASFKQFSGIAYTGQYANADIHDSPSFDLDDIIQPHGHNTELDLHTLQVIQETIGYHGQIANVDEFTVPKPIELEILTFIGDDTVVEIATLPVLQPDTVKSGGYADTDLTDSPSFPIDFDVYSGLYGESDIQVTPHFSADGTTGGFSNATMSTAESEGVGLVKGYTGAYGELYLSPTWNMPSDGYHGAYSVLNDLSVTYSFDVNVYSGNQIELDLATYDPPELKLYGHGGEILNDFTLNVTSALYPRAYTGAYADASLTQYLGSELSCDARTGAYMAIDALDETNWVMWWYADATCELDSLSITQNMPSVGYAGEHLADFDMHSSFVTLGNSDAGNGAYALVPTGGLEVPQGTTLLMNAYAGETTHVITDIRSHAKMKCRPIISSQTMRDGGGGIGSINHCETTQLDDYYGDNVLRFESYTNVDYPNDGLIIRFDDFGDRPWNDCSETSTVFSVELQCNPRFQIEIAADNTSIELYIERKLLAFGEVPDSVLYSEDGSGNRHDNYTLSEKTFDVEFNTSTYARASMDDADDFVVVADTSTSLEFTPTKFADFKSGANAHIDIFSTPYAEWRNFIHDCTTGHDVYLDFAPILYHRFCKGYIQPVGNNVVIEFNEVDNVDCSGYFIRAGETFNPGSLQTSAGIGSRNYTGEYMQFSLTLSDKWSLRAYTGTQNFAFIPSNVFMEVDFRDGTYSTAKFFEPDWIGYHGTHCALDGIEFSGPDVGWITDETCLPNDYVPVTEGGDLDYDALDPDNDGILEIPPVPVERIPYKFVLEAECLGFVEEGE